LNTSGQAYTSLAASADGTRLVATEVRSTASLWQVPVRDGIVDATLAKRLEIPTPQGSSPRLAPGFVLYRAQKAGTDGIWKLAEGAAMELWSGAEGRVTDGPALAPDGRRFAFVVQNRGLTRLYVMSADGGGVRRIAEGLELRGAPAWSPDGEWIAIGTMHGTAPGLLKFPVEGGDPVPLVEGYAVDPVWSPSGDFLVFSGADVGTNFQVGAVNADGTPRALPLLLLSRGSRRLDFMGEDRLVLLRGNLSHKELWVVDLTSGAERQLTALGPGPMIRDFDISYDGRELVFDQVREESDIILIDLPQADLD
jgi:Tol biopolymer transport system component